MSAKPVKKQAARKTPKAESALAPSSSGKARDRLDALNLAYTPEPVASTGPESSLPLAFWDQGPPLAIRARSGGVLFANAAYAELQDMLTERVAKAQDQRTKRVVP